MNITREETNPLEAKISIHFAPEDYKETVTNELKKQAKSASLPGFRPGKVPLSVVRRMIGKSVMVDQLGKLLQDKLNEYIDKEELKILGQPIPISELKEDELDASCTKPLDFSFEVGISPDIEANFDLKKVPALNTIEADDKFLDEEVEKLREQFGDIEYPEEVGEGDTFYVSIVENSRPKKEETEEDAAKSEEEGAEEPEGQRFMAVINPKRHDVPKILKAFKGKKVDDEFEIVFSKLADDKTWAEILYSTEDVVKELNKKKMFAEVKRVNRIMPAELNADFFSKALTRFQVNAEEGEVEDEGKFKEILKENLEKDLEASAKGRFRRKVQDALIDAHEIQLPEPFLKKWLVTSREDLLEENVDEYYENNYEKSLKWSLLMGKLVEENPDEIKVEYEDILENVREMAKAQLSQLPEEEQEKAIQSYLGEQKNFENHFNGLFEDKTFNFLMDKYKPKSKKISATKFFKEE